MDRAARALGWLDPELELSCMGWRVGPLDAAITDGCGAGGGGGGRSGGVDGTLGAGAGGGGCDGAAGMRDISGVSSGPFGTCAGWPASVRMSWAGAFQLEGTHPTAQLSCSVSRCRCRPARALVQGRSLG